MRQIAPEHEGQEQKPIMPERSDTWLISRNSHHARAIIDAKAEGARPDPEQAEAECDQPTRPPTFYFQLRGPELLAAASFQR